VVKIKEDYMKKFDKNKNVLLMIPQRKVNIEWEKMVR